MTTLISVAAAAVAILSATPAQTQGAVTVSTTLTYQTLDVASVDGAAAMLKRIELAARKLCAPDSPAASHISRRVLACRRAATSRAVNDLAAPLVTAAYERRREPTPLFVAKR